MRGSLRITEIFYSLQGESTFVGLPTVFIRLTGCPLRCGYCDTAYAFKGGKRQSIEEILNHVAQYNTPYVTVTGGEPLAQPDCLNLLTALCDKQYTVTLETSGALPVNEVDSRVIQIMDLKTPDSGECDKNHWANLDYLNEQDQIKFVICSHADYQWAKDIVQQHSLASRHTVLFSPSYESLASKELAEWILGDQLSVRLQIQLHKVLWQDAAGR